MSSYAVETRLSFGGIKRSRWLQNSHHAILDLRLESTAVLRPGRHEQ